MGSLARQHHELRTGTASWAPSPGRPARPHRIDRTGRARRSGDAVSLVTPRERHLLKAIEKATQQSLVSMTMPSVEDINASRLIRFDDAITAALATERVDFFRDVIGHYVNEFNVPEADAAAALAVVLQGDEPMMLEPEPVRPARSFDDRGPRDRRDDRDSRGGGRSERGDRGPRRPASGPMAKYRIAVGRRQRVEPRQIVGALANEGGLGRQDFGHIDIRADHSIVELPATLPPGAWEKLRSTRISGQLIELTRDDGPRSDGGTAGRSSAAADRRDGQGPSAVCRGRYARTGRCGHPPAATHVGHRLTAFAHGLRT